MTAFDRRLTPARPDLAAAHLEGKVKSARFVAARKMRVVQAAAPLWGSPSTEAPLNSEALYGEDFDVYEIAAGFAWGQLERDGYVGYLPASALAPAGAAPTHRVAALRSYAFPGPSIKLPPLQLLSLGSLVEIARQDGSFLVTPDGMHLWATHLAPLETVEPDYVAVAERFVGAPYRWGGRTSLGLDCSGLVQLSTLATGRYCPRDSDMQENGLGDAVALSELASGIRRGDRIHWKGHVGIMLDAERLLHANGHHMMVVVEPLTEAAQRIEQAGAGPIRTIRRSGVMG